MTDGYGQLCPECGDPYIGGRGCYAGACAAEPEEDDPWMDPEWESNPWLWLDPQPAENGADQ
jgi:hypothetical protein